MGDIAGPGRSRIVAGALVVGAVSAVCSTAWGCQVLAGKMTVTGNAGTGVVTAVGDGNQNDFGWCPGYPMGKAKATRGGTISVLVSKAGTLACTTTGPTRLSAGTYDVNYINGAAFTRTDKTDKDNTDGSRRWIDHCLSRSGGGLVSILPGDDGPDIVKLGSMSVNQFGKGSGTYNIPSTGVVSGPTDEAAVCVSSPGGGEGNQVPLTIV